MRIRSVSIQNFGSIKELEFSFENLGLTLLSGVSGSGKSTVMDAVKWGLFGDTAKDLAADDVKSWGTEEPTQVSVEIDYGAEDWTVTRIRGKAAQNDVYFTLPTEPDEKRRGKDAVDTQKILDQKLCINGELFDLTSYFSQWSAADSFFTAKAVQRRETLEKICDMSLAVTLAEKSSEHRKLTKKQLETTEADYQKYQGAYEQSLAQKASVERLAAGWADRNMMEVAALENKCSQWEQDQVREAAAIKAQTDAWEIKRGITLSQLAAKNEAFESDNLAQIEALELKGQQLIQERLKLDDTEQLEYQISDLRDDYYRNENARKILGEMLADSKSRLSQSEREKRKHEQASDVCPSCDRPGAKANHELQIEALDAEIRTGTAQVATFTKETKELESLITEQLELIEAMRCACRDVELKRQRLESEFSNYLNSMALLSEQENPHIVQIELEQAKVNPFLSMAEGLTKRLNPYTQFLNATRSQSNPHYPHLLKLDEDSTTLAKEIKVKHQAVNSLKQRVAQLTCIYDLSFSLRGALLRTSVAQLEQETNSALETYFDGEFRVKLELDADKLGVQIFRNGHNCAFKQLSGGQRRMLTLCLWSSLRKLALNKAGVSVSLLMLDECLNGLDEGLKIKAFRMLEALESEHETVILIEHSESIKECFNNRFEVELVGDHSQVTHVSSSS